MVFHSFVYLVIIYASQVLLRKPEKEFYESAVTLPPSILASSSHLCFLMLFSPSVLTPVVTLRPAIVASAASLVLPFPICRVVSSPFSTKSSPPANTYAARRIRSDPHMHDTSAHPSTITPTAPLDVASSCAHCAREVTRASGGALGDCTNDSRKQLSDMDL
ncbi:hypothetical protein H4582DRAFT_465919 [Lactarius indigo]|nr:hypothetical protein H4582DRAFT_465919 [Lactarius indigo]